MTYELYDEDSYFTQLNTVMILLVHVQQDEHGRMLYTEVLHNSIRLLEEVVKDLKHTI